MEKNKKEREIDKPTVAEKAVKSISRANENAHNVVTAIKYSREVESERLDGYNGDHLRREGISRIRPGGSSRFHARHVPSSEYERRGCFYLLNDEILSSSEYFNSRRNISSLKYLPRGIVKIIILRMFSEPSRCIFISLWSI